MPAPYMLSVVRGWSILITLTTCKLELQSTRSKCVGIFRTAFIARSNCPLGSSCLGIARKDLSADLVEVRPSYWVALHFTQAHSCTLHILDMKSYEAEVIKVEIRLLISLIECSATKPKFGTSVIP